MGVKTSRAKSKAYGISLASHKIDNSIAFTRHKMGVWISQLMACTEGQFNLQPTVVTVSVTVTVLTYMIRSTSQTNHDNVWISGNKRNIFTSKTPLLHDSVYCLEKLKSRRIRHSHHTWSNQALWYIRLQLRIRALASLSLSSVTLYTLATLRL
jgi:hypothetical protein